MTATVAIVAPGEMGSFMGQTLVRGGARVVTSVVGRSPASRARAEAAGFVLVDSDAALVDEAQFIMSVVPPPAALDLADRFAQELKKTSRQPIYVDCNAVAPRTAAAIGDRIRASGTAFVDGGLFGGPTSGKPGVALYVSGPDAASLQQLQTYGLTVRIVSGEIGAASALKLSFAALNKGFTALGALSLLNALPSGSGPGLLEQLAQTQPGLLAYMSRFIPAMFPKAHRWAPEMDEIATFLAGDPEARDVYLALGRLYRRIADDVANDAPSLAALRQFCQEGRDAQTLPESSGGSAA